MILLMHQTFGKAAKKCDTFIPHIVISYLFINIYIYIGDTCTWNPTTKNQDSPCQPASPSFNIGAPEVSGGLMYVPNGQMSSYTPVSSIIIESMMDWSYTPNYPSGWSQEKTLLERWWQMLCTGSLPLKAADGWSEVRRCDWNISQTHDSLGWWLGNVCEFYLDDLLGKDPTLIETTTYYSLMREILQTRPYC